MLASRTREKAGYSCMTLLIFGLWPKSKFQDNLRHIDILSPSAVLQDIVHCLKKNDDSRGFFKYT